MEKRKLIKRIYRTGEANIYDISGWVSKIQAYAISNHTPTQKSIVVPTQNPHTDSVQFLGTNKEQDKEIESMPGRQRFDEMRKQRGV
jgi:hypothetical protein